MIRDPDDIPRYEVTVTARVTYPVRVKAYLTQEEIDLIDMEVDTDWLLHHDVDVDEAEPLWVEDVGCE